MVKRYRWAILGISLAICNLALSYHFRLNTDHFDAPTLAEAQWFFIAKPAFNWGGFFVDGDSPTIHRLPTVLFLLWASVSLGKYLLVKRTALQSLSAIMLLCGLVGLALDILSYGSVCDWLGFSFPGATFYSMLNISDLMILVSAPVVAIVCFQRLLFSIPAFIFAIAVIGANTYYHFNYLFFGTHP